MATADGAISQDDTQRPLWGDPTIDTRNVKDEFKGMPNEEIRASLSKRKRGFGVAMGHIEGDFNFGCLVRNANAFGADMVHYIDGRRHWDRRSSVGTHHYTSVQHWEDWDAFLDDESGTGIPVLYSLVAIENNVAYETVDLREFVWPEIPMMIFGEEGNGIPEEALTRIVKMGGSVVSIPDFGSVRSINVASAASVAMYDFISKQQESPNARTLSC